MTLWTTAPLVENSPPGAVHPPVPEGVHSRLWKTREPRSIRPPGDHTGVYTPFFRIFNPSGGVYGKGVRLEGISQFRTQVYTCTYTLYTPTNPSTPYTPGVLGGVHLYSFGARGR